MRIRAPLSIVIAHLSFMSAASGEASVGFDFDRFKNRTTVEMPVFSSILPKIYAGAVIPVWQFVYAGKQRNGPPSTAYLHFWSMSQDWRFARCHSVDFLIDEKPTTIRYSRTPDFAGSRAMETLTINLDNVLLTKLVTAKKLEYRVCTFEGVFPPTQLESLKARIADSSIAVEPTK